jgi:hypothetical protein
LFPLLSSTRAFPSALLQRTQQQLQEVQAFQQLDICPELSVVLPSLKLSLSGLGVLLFFPASLALRAVCLEAGDERVEVGNFAHFGQFVCQWFLGLGGGAGGGEEEGLSVPAPDSVLEGEAEDEDDLGIGELGRELGEALGVEEGGEVELEFSVLAEESERERLGQSLHLI